MLENNHLYMLYCSLILPYLSYACEIWGNTYKSPLNTLMLLQKKAIRNVAKASYLDHTHPLFVQHNCLKFLDIVKLKTLIIIYKAKNNMLPNNLQKMFTTIKEIHSYGTRSSRKGNFNVKYCKTKRKLMSISIIGVKL